MNRITDVMWHDELETTHGPIGYYVREACIEIMDTREDLDTYFAQKRLDELYGPGDYS